MIAGRRGRRRTPRARSPPARAAGKLHYVHVACTEFLTAMHTGDRTKEAIDAGGILPGYTGTIVRDGYKGYEHLTGALHAWCGAHGLRDLAGLYRSGPDGQVWARSMADLLIDANAKATAARAAGQASLTGEQLARIRSWYRGAVIFSDDGRLPHNWKPCMRPLGSPLGISWWMIPLPAVIHWTSPAPIAPLLPMLSPCSTVPART